jgi:hypothetical protein
MDAMRDISTHRTVENSHHVRACGAQQFEIVRRERTQRQPFHIACVHWQFDANKLRTIHTVLCVSTIWIRMKWLGRF